MIKQTPILVLLLLISVFSAAQDQPEVESIEIELSQKQLTVAEALKEIIEHTTITLVYNIDSEILNTPIRFSSKKLPLTKAFEEITTQVPVDVIYNKNQIIIKNKKLSEKYSIKGQVIDAETKVPLIASSIYIANSTKGTVTDENGFFQLSLSPGHYILECKYLGYKEQKKEVYLYKNQTLEILLRPIKQNIEEVNVFGNKVYNAELEKGRPIEVIESKTIEKLTNNNISDALHAQVNGVWATKVSGAPGDHQKIRIRGISSIYGATDPLYVVDGMIIPIVNFNSLGVSDINTNDVESITILKDASSTVTYGYLGGNGVILIDTKKSDGEPSLNFSTKKGYQWMSKRYPLMTSKDFLNTLQASDSINGTEFYYVRPSWNIYEKYPLYEDTLGNIMVSDDFQDEIFRLGEISEYQFSGSGHTNKLNFYMSGNYYNHEGIVINSEYKKYTATGSLSYKAKDKLFMNVIYRASRQENLNNQDNYLGNNVVFKGINYEPSYRSTPDSFLVKQNRMYYNDPYNTLNRSLDILSAHTLEPDVLFRTNIKRKDLYSNSACFLGKYIISEHLNANASFSFSDRRYKFNSSVKNPLGHKTIKSNENYIGLSQEYKINYSNKIKNSDINSYVLYRNYIDNVFWNVSDAIGIDQNSIAPEDDIFVRGSMAIFGKNGSVIRRISSYIGVVNYNYNEKYSVSLIANYDNLSEGNNLSVSNIFYSTALDWDLSKESFFKQFYWINAFHLYGNWGQSGNYPLNSLSNDLYVNPANAYDYNYAPIDSSKLATKETALISNLSNHNIKNESVEEYNIGIKLSLFRNELMLNVDKYFKSNSNLIISREIPYYYGGGAYYDNIGEMKNNGLEVSLEFSPFDNSEFQWRTRLGYSKNAQYITKLYKEEEINFNNPDVLIPDFKAQVNEQLGTIMGYKYLGVYEKPDTKTIDDAEPEEPLIKTVNHLGINYLKVDTLNLNELVDEDKIVIGKSIPDFTLNWINALKYKSFSCDMVWYAVVGVDKFNATKASTYISGVNKEVRGIVTDTMNFNTDNILYESSYFIEYASFIRLKTLSFTYSQPKQILNKIDIKYTLNFENILTLTQYSGYDPESTIYTRNNFSDNAIDRGAYPNPKSVYLKISLSF
ncbi:MAG: SusC/RagA family TonB-linked outer membrane protein [Bacteroidales bacterium]|nr:SusC/RagA family TonB-linked outer membrane protein [Bacteroidales bacterium]